MTTKHNTKHNRKPKRKREFNKLTPLYELRKTPGAKLYGMPITNQDLNEVRNLK